MISHLSGGNCTQDEHERYQRSHDEAVAHGFVTWDGALPDVTTGVPFPQAVRGARALVGCGANPIIAAAAVQRAWLAERRAAGVTVPGASDQFVSDVGRVVARDKREASDASNVT